MSNRLAAATSPYLLQHKDNPVHWHEWNDEAFARAKAENKPVFLSIGYSTCHWCHVMAHESFENPDVARVLNEYFVAIKVDREERPDIDRLYMAFVQATTGSGGWPMSVWLTPKAEPFFGGTYFPPTDRHGRPGFVTVLERIAELWAQEPDRITAQGAEVLAALEESSSPASSSSSLTADPLTAGLDAFAASYDPARGGFGGGPKFPRPSVFNFLLRRPEPAALEMTLHTLRRMAAGGLRDHLGGGFHRYSVDGEWHVPHFEKMLYDQAQLVVSYVEAWQITGDGHFAAIARDTLAYVSRDLTHAAGGFFSAEDADSLFEHGRPEHGEGAFYVWSYEEIARRLEPETAAAFNRHYGVEPAGNVDPAADPHHEFTGRNILFERKPGDPASLESARATLFAARAQRPRPHLDDKILTAWNGLMISAFARAGSALGEPAYLAAARRAAEFLRAEMFDSATGELFRTWRDGRAAIRAFAEDYTFLVQALLDLYEADFDPAWLEWARTLQAKQDALFFDAATGSYLGSAEGDPLVPLRLRDDYDGAEPSANSIAALNLLRLGWMLHDDGAVERARGILQSFATILRRMPSAVPQMLCALDMLLTPPRQYVLAGPLAEAAPLLGKIRRAHAPNRVLLRAGHTPASAGMTAVDGRPAVYVCENFACRAPITDPAELTTAS